MELEIASLGAAKLDPDTSAPVVHSQIDQGDGEPSDYGETPLACALGLTALPAAADATGHAEGVLAKGLGGSTGMCVGARDVRCADVAKGLGPGGTALHSTGADASKRSQVRCLENKIVTLIGNDSVVTIDRGSKVATADLWGYHVEVSDSQGIMLMDKTGATLQLKGGKFTVSANMSAAGGVATGLGVAVPVALAPALATYLGTLTASIVTALGAADTALNGLAPGTGVTAVAFAGGMTAAPAQLALVAAVSTTGN